MWNKCNPEPVNKVNLITDLLWHCCCQGPSNLLSNGKLPFQLIFKNMLFNILETLMYFPSLTAVTASTVSHPDFSRSKTNQLAGTVIIGWKSLLQECLSLTNVWYVSDILYSSKGHIFYRNGVKLQYMWARWQGYLHCWHVTAMKFVLLPNQPWCPNYKYLWPCKFSCKMVSIPTAVSVNVTDRHGEAEVTRSCKTFNEYNVPSLFILEH